MDGRDPSAARGGAVTRQPGWWEAPGVDGAVRRLRRLGTAVLCVTVGPRAYFPGGPSVSRLYWSLDSARDPVPRSSLCVAAAPPRRCWPPLRPRTPHPLPGPGPVTARASSVGGVPGGVGPEGRGARYSAGERSPGPAAALGVGGGGREPRRVAPREPGRPFRVLAPLCWGPLAVRSRGVPRRPTRFRIGLKGPGDPRNGARPPTSTVGSLLPQRLRDVGLTWPHPGGAPLRPSVR